MRERHLGEVTKQALAVHIGIAPSTRVVGLAEWPSLGRSTTDVVVDVPRRDLPLHVVELKWCQEGHDKVYEAIWDLFKIALMTRIPSVLTGHLVTGAPMAVWRTAFCGDIFDGGTFTPEQLCRRVLPWSRTRRLAWDHLLEGGFAHFPDRVPGEIESARVGAVQVGDRRGIWEIRAVRVRASDPVEDVLFRDGWPLGDRPAGARYPTSPA